MDREVYSFALTTALNEIRDVCPDIKNSFMFQEDGEILAGDEDTPKKVVARIMDSFNGIMEKAEAIGGVQGITLEAAEGRVNISCIDDLYLLTVTSQEADMNYLNTVTQVLIPTILRLLEKIHPASLKKQTPKEEEKPEEEETEKEKREETPETEPEPPVNQLIIEELSGFLVPSDEVRIDTQILSQWQESCEQTEIEKVEVETFDGKKTRCKVEPIKDSKYQEKGVIRMPEKIQHTLKIRKGELVRVKPVLD